MIDEDKRILDKEMKRLCYLGILQEGFSAYSSPVMFISRKVTQDKRVVTDFRHLNTRIAKNNLAHPLVKDTFTTLGNSKCDSSLSIRSEGCFLFIVTIRKLKEILCVSYHTLEVPHTCIKGFLWDLMSPHQFGKLI